MALSRTTVARILDVVASDPESNRRVNSWLRWMDIADSGTAGVVRNYSIAFADMMTFGQVKALDPSEREQLAYLYSCDGIAEATAAAIRPKVKEIPRLVRVDEQARERGYSHTGTLLEMDDGTKYVLDWWKSLSIRDPFVFKYQSFMWDLGDGINYTNWSGYS